MNAHTGTYFMVKDKAIIGCILGTAVGDALGLPYEGMSPTRARKLLGPPDRYRFVFGRGMISDDTEHTCMVSQSLIESGDIVDTFTRRFASRLRWWILALPAGVGKATARSCMKLWFGISPSKSGSILLATAPPCELRFSVRRLTMFQSCSSTFELHLV